MRPTWLLLVIPTATGCSFQPVAATTGGGDGSAMHDAHIIDSAIDAPPDAFDAACFGSGKFYFCLNGPPSGAQTLPSPPTSVDTSTCNFTGAQIVNIGNTSACALAGDSIDISDNADVIGSRPLVLVATNAIDISGYIDASSSNGNGDGPGANDPSCANTTIDGVMNAAGGGGGAGGSFGSRGANGATGGTNTGTGGTSANAVTPPVTTLRGGCRGGAGAIGAQGSRTANGGSGGGAVYVVARGMITVSGTIDVSGAGGTGGASPKGGGGGGGSGGMVVLHGNVVATGGTVFANGGGGGGGAGQGTAGNNGSDASMWNMTAAGGPGGGGGISPGGNGAFLMTNAVKPANAGNGGGGGGAGVGVIRLLGGAQLTGANVSPAPS